MGYVAGRTLDETQFDPKARVQKSMAPINRGLASITRRQAMRARVPTNQMANPYVPNASYVEIAPAQQATSGNAQVSTPTGAVFPFMMNTGAYTAGPARNTTEHTRMNYGGENFTTKQGTMLPRNSDGTIFQPGQSYSHQYNPSNTHNGYRFGKR